MRKFKKFLSIVLTLSMVVGMLNGIGFELGTKKALATDANVLDITSLEAQTISENKTFGIFTITANSSKTVVIEGNSKFNEDGSVEFANRMKLGGVGSVEYRSIKVSATEAGFVKVYALSSSSGSDRPLVLTDKNGNELERNVFLGKYDENKLIPYTYTIPQAGDFYIFSADSGINVYYVEFISAVTVYDFRDGSIVPTDTNGKQDIAYGDLSITVGNKNAYQYNGAQHGVAFKGGNTVSIKVSGPTKVTVGDCAYSNITEMTLKSADGSYAETLATKTGCYHNDGSALVFNYTGSATTLSIEFAGTAYVPVIMVAPLTEEVGDDNGVAKDSFYIYNFCDESVVPATYDSANRVPGTITSKDGFLRINSAGQLYAHDKDHGLAVFAGDTFDIDVAGDAIIAVDTCMYGTDALGKYTIKSQKGEIVSENTAPAQITAVDGTAAYFKYEGVATTLTISVSGGTGEYYLHNIEVYNLPEAQKTPAKLGNGKIDVWDFGADVLDETKYNNLLTVDAINALSPDVEPGTSGVNIKSFATEDIFFNASGKVNNRYRTTNTALTRYDSKSLNFTEEDGTTTTLNGYIYSNNSTTMRVYVGVKLYANDICTVYFGTNSGDSTIYVEGPNGKVVEQKIGHEGAKITFAAACSGLYKFYSLDEKLVVYRIFREHTAPVAVTGTITTPENLKDYSLEIKNVQTGEVIEVEPKNGAYSFTAYESFEYAVALLNANGYVISTGDTLKVESDASMTSDIVIERVALTEVKGTISGLSEEALKKLNLKFVNEETVYVPEVKITGNTYSVELETGVRYDVVISGVNDYELTSKDYVQAGDTEYVAVAGDNYYKIARQFEVSVKELIKLNSTDGKLNAIKKGAKIVLPDANGAVRDITFAPKKTSHVVLDIKASSAVKKNLVVTFTNINESGYTYTFKHGDYISLRDGQYKVTVSGIGNYAYIQDVTSDVIVKGEKTKATINLEKVTSWNFAELNKAYGGAGIEKIDDGAYYSGLVLNSQVLENKTYLLLNTNGEIKVPVKKGDIVTLSYCYCAGFMINGDETTIVDSKSGSTSKIESVTYTAPAKGYVTISSYAGTNASQTYFTSIDVVTPVKYSAKVYVGADKQYKTINAALEAIAKMNRVDKNGNVKRVEIVIDPGNYEEMVRVEVENVSFINAAGDKASIELLNKGVDIAENAVRITSYYGHGYNYFSMGADYFSDEKLLEVNKVNGYATTTNPGAGTGTFWNATTIIAAPGFIADGIIFENSFNQYISAKEANDVLVLATGNKGVRPTTVGDTSVQSRKYVERAAALAMTAKATEAYFNNCKFVGRQDTLYGAVGTTVGFNKCSVYGAVDYIFGGMTAVFKECDLVMNTDDKTSSDEAYLTAAQQSGGRGYLMLNCTVTSTKPGIDTASEKLSKPGYFGRPWAANTSEVVFYNTTIETTDFNGTVESLIKPVAWMNSLGGESKKMYEYGTKELSGVDNSASRASWSTVLTEGKLSDGTDISTEEKAIKAFLGDFNPFK